MDEIEKILNKYGTVVVKQLRDDIKSKPATKYGPANASGKLANSLKFVVTETGLKVYALGYFYYVENGRKAGKAPPRKAIEQWITDKGIVSEISTKSLAYLIQRKIAREGTEAHKQGGTKLLGDIVTQDFINAIRSDLFGIMKEYTIRSVRSAMLQKAA